MNGNEFYLGTQEHGSWELYSVTGGGGEASLEHDQLLELYVEGSLTLLPPGGEDQRVTQARVYAELAPANRARVDYRAAYLERIDTLMASVPRGKRAAALRRAIEIAGGEFEGPSSVSSYRRWKALVASSSDLCDLAGQFQARGRKPIRGRIGEIISEVFEYIVECASGPRPIFLTMKWAQDEIAARIAEERRSGADVDGGAAVSRSTVYRRWKQIDAYRRDVAKQGTRRTEADYRRPRGVRPDLVPMDIGEYDQTRLPLYFFDEDSGVPLGIPWLNWVLDRASIIPAGIYLGFEPPGDMTALATLRHACLPKTYVAKEYPDIKNRYLPHGIFKRLTFDNEAMAHGNTVKVITNDLRSHFAITPSRTPWFKARVEGMFNAMNQRFLRELNGFVFSPALRPDEYDPAHNGCIGLRYFLYLFHTWLIDIYCQTPIGAEKLTPAQRWERGTEHWPPDLVDSAANLDLLFGVVREGRLDHKGVRYERLWYYSSELHELRVRLGGIQTVQVKINPTELSAVHVFDEDRRRWIRVVAIRERYTKGLSLHRHLLNLKAADEVGADIDGNGLEEANERLRALISGSLGHAMGVQTTGLLARAVGIGTQHIFSHMKSDGELNALSGPFEGKALNPTQLSPSHEPASATSASLEEPEHVRRRTQLRADLSLADLPRDR